MRLIYRTNDVILRGIIEKHFSVTQQRYIDVVTALLITDKGIERYIELGNRYIYLHDETGRLINLEDDKELLCYWISKQNFDDYDLERFFLCDYFSCLWKHKARTMLIREKRCSHV